MFGANYYAKRYYGQWYFGSKLAEVVVLPPSPSPAPAEGVDYQNSEHKQRYFLLLQQIISNTEITQ